ncbi:MAG TPA: cobyrinate a,c-diamide synthase [Arcobacter sp.]|nr:cobyrinate a,c-diamide synthase [Arcobacter sp.]HIP56158.1 cobyrinate a,c-diamide synthase [Arcobacter sp.]
MLNICISALASNQGKTIFTTALLNYFKASVRPFKIGPDFIDPQFHKKVCGTNSINLDSFIMNESQVAWLYNKYSNKKVSILEGVMGFYDGQDKGCSAYSVSKLLNIPTILILDASGSYITIGAVLKGMLSYKKDNTIKAIVLNNISSSSHFELIKKQINKEYKNTEVLGWIKSNLTTLQDTHLGLHLDDLGKIKDISLEVLEHIDMKKLKKLAKTKRLKNTNYPFKKLEKIDKKLVIIKDDNFSFLYHDNLVFLKETYKSVKIINSSKNEKIPKDTNIVYICGGYIETIKAYNNIKDLNKFKKSLINHSKKKTIYAECAGLLYLGNRVDDKKMTGILDIDFTLDSRFNRLGYYYNSKGIKGHSFHYTKPLDSKNGFDTLSKSKDGIGKVGSWRSDNKKVFGTYLHTMFRNNTNIIKDKF